MNEYGTPNTPNTEQPTDPYSFGQGPSTPTPEYRPYRDPAQPSTSDRPAIGSPYEPISIGSFLLVMIACAIPIINFIVLIILAVTSTKVNMKNFAIAQLILWVIGIALGIIFWASILAFFVSGFSDN